SPRCRGRAVLVGRAHRQSLQEGASFGHGLIGMIDRELIASRSASFGGCSPLVAYTGKMYGKLISAIAVSPTYVSEEPFNWSTLSTANWSTLSTANCSSLSTIVRTRASL